ncbi:MAG: hypothetical protein P0119_21500 [Nitrospira sp.]|nr:hypothetical protein [Nitrospira sp.]
MQPTRYARRPQNPLTFSQSTSRRLFSQRRLCAGGSWLPTRNDHIDIVVPAYAAAGERVKDALLILPDQAAKEIEPAWFEEGENIRVADAFVVDVMLNANGQTHETLQPYAETIEFEGIPVSTINLEGLLLTKQTLREKDLPDRIVIERALEVMRASRTITESR